MYIYTHDECHIGCLWLWLNSQWQSDMDTNRVRHKTKPTREPEYKTVLLPVKGTHLRFRRENKFSLWLWSRFINVPIVVKMLRKYSFDILNIERKWLCLISRRYLSQSRRFLLQTLTEANTTHRLWWRDKSAVDCYSDSSLLFFHTRSPTVVSLSSRVDISVMIQTIIFVIFHKVEWSTRHNDSKKFSHYFDCVPVFSKKKNIEQPNIEGGKVNTSR
jgi:hypothetical protein